METRVLSESIDKDTGSEVVVNTAPLPAENCASRLSEHLFLWLYK